VIHPLANYSWRFFRTHPAQLAMALIGLSMGVAVITGVALMRDSLIESLDSATQTLVGQTSLRITRPGGDLLDDDWTGLVLQTASPALVPIVQARVRHGEQILEMIGGDWLNATPDSPLNPASALVGALVADAAATIVNQATAKRLGIATGQTLTVDRQGRQLELAVAAVLPGQPALDQVLITDIAVAKRLLDRPGTLSWIAAPESAKEWLATHLPPDLRFATAEQRRSGVARLTRGMRVNLSALSLLALVVGLFVVHAVLSFLQVQRQRQIGLLRALGLTRARLTGWLLSEALVLAFLGIVLGLVAGTWLADRLLLLLSAPAAELYGLVTSRRVQPTLGLYGLVAALTLTLALLSSWSILTQALRIPPGPLSRRHDAPPKATRSARLRPLLLAGGCALVGGLVLAVSSGLVGALIGLFGLLAGCAMIVPSLAIGLIGLWYRRRTHATDGLALGMLASSQLRLAPAVTALTLALALSAGVVLMVLSFRTAVDDWINRLVRADVYVSLSQDMMTAAQVAQIRAWPEVAAVSSVRRGEASTGPRLFAYDLPDPAWQGFDFLAGGDARARDSFEQGRGVLVSEPLAQRHRLSLGAIWPLTTPAGLKRLPIVGVYRDFATEIGTIALSAKAYRQWFSSDAVDSLGLYLHPDTDQAALHLRLINWNEAVRLTPRSAVREQTLAVFDRTFRITWALALLTGLTALTALISALLALSLERRAEFASLRALGLTRSQMSRWIMVQTVGLSLIAALLAMPISALIHAVLTLSVQPRAFGWTIPLTFDARVWLVLPIIAAIAGALAGWIPATAIARRSPIRALRAP